MRYAAQNGSSDIDFIILEIVNKILNIESDKGRLHG
jgi:hypothetical protein